MSNKIFLAYQSKDPETGKLNNVEKAVPLIDDILLEINSQFSSFGELIPQLKSLLELGATVQSSLSGGVSSTILDLFNKLDVPTWKKTDPIRFQVSLAFYTQENGAYEDVYKPITDLASYTMLMRKGKSFITPGLNVKNISKASQNGKDKENTFKRAEGTRLLTVYVPGVVYIANAFIRSARPTFSKYKTTKGFPLWGKVDLQIESLFPANDLVWDNVRILTQVLAQNKTQADKVETFKEIGNASILKEGNFTNASALKGVVF